MASSSFLNLTNQGGPFSSQQVAPAADNTAAPPFSFLGDLNTGLGSSAADTVNLVTGGTSRLSVSTAAVTSTVPYLAPNGTAAAPSISATNAPSLGFYVPSAGFMGAANGAGSVFVLENQSNTLTFGADITVRWGSSGTSTPDVSLSRLSAGRLSTDALGRVGGITSLGVTGVPVVVAVGRVTAQSAANASISTFTVGAADASFEVSGNMNVTASTVLTTTLTVTYTDETNTARSMILPVASLAGSFIAAGAITGSGATVWETPVMHIRCKAATVITILTSAGTFTSVVYTAEGIIKQCK